MINLLCFLKLSLNNILGLKDESGSDNNYELVSELIDLLLKLRIEARTNKDFKTSDKIRDEMKNLGIEVKDKKDGFDWNLK